MYQISAFGPDLKITVETSEWLQIILIYKPNNLHSGNTGLMLTIGPVKTVKGMHVVMKIPFVPYFYLKRLYRLNSYH